MRLLCSESASRTHEQDAFPVALSEFFWSCATQSPHVPYKRGHRPPIVVFKSTSAESVGEGRWALHGNLSLRGQTRPITVQVRLKDGRYTGEATVKQTDFGIKPPGKAGVRAKAVAKIEFNVRLAS